jgi:hypothetical protein
MTLLFSLLALSYVATVQAGPQVGPQRGGSSAVNGLARPSGFIGAGRSAGSPAYTWIFERPLPIPPIAQPKFTKTLNGIPVQFYESEIKSFTHQVYPNLGPANLVGYGMT